MPAGSLRYEASEYDAGGLLLKKTDSLGLVREYTYTSRDQMETVTRNVGGTKDLRLR